MPESHKVESLGVKVHCTVIRNTTTISQSRICTVKYILLSYNDIGNPLKSGRLQRTTVRRCWRCRMGMWGAQRAGVKCQKRWIDLPQDHTWWWMLVLSVAGLAWTSGAARTRCSTQMQREPQILVHSLSCIWSKGQCLLLIDNVKMLTYVQKAIPQWLEC